MISSSNCMCFMQFSLQKKLIFQNPAAAASTLLMFHFLRELFFSISTFYIQKKISHGFFSLPLYVYYFFLDSHSLSGEHPAAMQHNIALCITPMSFLFTTFLLCIVIASKYRLNNVQVFNFIR
jgi:hypothetical protein